MRIDWLGFWRFGCPWHNGVCVRVYPQPDGSLKIVTLHIA